MDEQVLAAMARWPNVPDVYGWLSLSARGVWHLHPGGHGWDFAAVTQAEPGGRAPAPDREQGTGGEPAVPPGEPISNPQFMAFINRNYTHDDAGR